MPNEPLTPAELDAAEKLCEEATPGPWRIFKSGSGLEIASKWGTEDWRGICQRLHADDHNAAFINASRTLLPRMIAQVRGLRKERDALKDCHNCRSDPLIYDPESPCAECMRPYSNWQPKEARDGQD